MAEVDYIVADRLSLEERIADLTRRASQARAEARHAREYPGLEAAARNAKVAADELERQAAELREVAMRVDRGYEWWDRAGFAVALEAYGEPWRWQQLAESVTRDFVYSDDDLDLRLPVDVQRAYGPAYESRLFSRFEICEWHETDGDFVVETRSFLFGITDFPSLGACSFLIAQWDSSMS